MENTAPLSDTQVQALLKQALDHLGRNEFVLGEAALNRLLEQDAANAEALQFMGVIRRAQNQLGEAEDFFRRSIASKPDQPLVHHNLGNLLRTTGRLDEAMVAQQEAIRLKPNFVEAWLDLALAQTEKDDLVQAEKSLRRALHIQPNFLFARQALGAILNGLGRPKEAETILRQTLALGPRDPRHVTELEHNLGVALKLQGRYEEALRFFDLVQQRLGAVPLLDFNRGHTLQLMGRLDEAEACYRRALQVDPQNEKIVRHLAEVHEQRGPGA